jgi:hypothetical protein
MVGEPVRLIRSEVAFPWACGISRFGVPAANDPSVTAQCQLTKAIYRLDGSPSPKTGAFHVQGWVVRKLKTLLPTIRDEAIHADLMEMVVSYEQNIVLITAKLAQPLSEGGSR